MQRVKVEVEPTRSTLATAMLNSKTTPQAREPRAVVGYGIKIVVPRPLHYITRSPGIIIIIIIIIIIMIIIIIGLKVNDQLVTYATRFLAVRLKSHVVAPPRLNNGT